MELVKKTYRLEPELVDKLAECAKAEGCTATDVLKKAIRAYGTEPDASHTEPYNSHTAAGGSAAAQEGGSSQDKALEALTEQLTVLSNQLAAKDKQLEAMQNIAAAAQETAKAAQALHAADVEAAALARRFEAQDAGLSRWQRLKQAWKGGNDGR